MVFGRWNGRVGFAVAAGRCPWSGGQGAKIRTEVKRRPDGGSTLWVQGAGTWRPKRGSSA